MTNSTAAIRRASAGRSGSDGLSARGRALVIAVDGPSGSGKSSAARGVATALGLCYLDTGAMYRAVTWWLLEHGVDLAETGSVIAHVQRLSIGVSTDPLRQQTTVDDIDVTTAIRSLPVTNAVSVVAAIPQVRSHLIAMQRAIIDAAASDAGGIVAEGRDIGTVVAPDAVLKVFLTASEQARADRRAAERRAAQISSRDDLPSAADTMHEQAQRDRHDAPQSEAAADAIKIDASKLGLDEVVNCIVNLARAKRVNG